MSIMQELRKGWSERLLTWSMKVMPECEEKELLHSSLKLYYKGVLPLILKNLRLK